MKGVKPTPNINSRDEGHKYWMEEFIRASTVDSVMQKK